MAGSIRSLSFDGALLSRGFWLYVWEIALPEGHHLYYVGRTGDSSSSNAQSPFNRMSQRLGCNKKNNVLRRRLKDRDIDPERCTFRLIAYGPILQEASSPTEHNKNRDHIAAMEKALADTMNTAGYQVLNPVTCHKQLDEVEFARVRAAFAEPFRKIRQNEAHGARHKR